MIVIVSSCDRHEAISMGNVVNVTPSGFLGTAAKIIDLEAATTQDGEIFVFLSVIRPPTVKKAVPRTELWWFHRNAEQDSWSPPALIAQGLTGPYSCIVSGKSTYIIAANSMIIMKRTDSNSDWNRIGSISSSLQIDPSDHAVVNIEGTHTAFAVGRIGSPHDSNNHTSSLALQAASYIDDGTIIAGPVFEIPGSYENDVCLSLVKNQDSIICYILCRTIQKRMKSHCLITAEWANKSQNWSWHRRHILPDADGIHTGRIETFEYIKLGERDLFIVQSSDLWVYPVDKEGNFDIPLRVSEYASGIKSHIANGVSTVRIGDDSLVLIWIDTDNRESDRKPWNPLGGFPWSDDTEWSNNDVFATTLHSCGLSGVIRRGSKTIRLTKQGSYSSSIMTVETMAGPIILLSSRDQVGKHLEDYDNPAILAEYRLDNIINSLDPNGQ